MTRLHQYALAVCAVLFSLRGLPAVAAPLAVAVEGSPSGLDPHIVTAFTSFQIIDGTIYEGLTMLDSNLNIQPGLASKWDISADKTTYTFTLRDGVTFHSGEPMSSKDVASSLRRVMDKQTGSPLASRLTAIAKIETPDDKTVVLHLSAPSAPLLASLTTIAIVPAKFEHDMLTLQRAPDGTGPFRMVAWQPDVAIRLARNPAYWQKGLPRVEGVNFEIVPEATTRQVGLVNGQYQILPNIDGAAAIQFQSQSGIKVQKTLDLAYSLIGMNVTRPPFDNPKVREAINYAINRSDIVAAALFGAGVPGGPLSPALTTYAKPVTDFPCFTPDISKAKALIAESGVATPIQAKLLVLPRDTTKVMAQIIQQQLAAIGIKLTLDIPEIGQFVQNWKNSNFDLFISLNAGTVEPDDYFYRTFRTGGSTNVFKYSNQKLDTLLDAGRAETDIAVRKKIYGDVQSLLACDGPAAFLTYGELYTAMRDNIAGYMISPNRSLRSLGTVSLGD